MTRKEIVKVSSVVVAGIAVVVLFTTNPVLAGIIAASAGAWFYAEKSL